MKNAVTWYLVDIQKGKEKYHINNIINVIMDANHGLFFLQDNLDLFKNGKTIAILKDDGDLYIYKKSRNKVGFKMLRFEPTEINEDYDNPDILSLDYLGMCS